jgi:hypothetical protein
MLNAVRGRTEARGGGCLLPAALEREILDEMEQNVSG